MKISTIILILFNLTIAQNPHVLNTYSLGNNFSYTDWKTAGNEGNMKLFCPDSSLAVGYEGNKR